MNKPLLLKRLILALALLVALQSLGAGRAIAQPALPSSFYGTVKYEGQNVPVGTPITAYIENVRYAITYARLEGLDTVFQINIGADNPDTLIEETAEAVEGKLIEFRVNNNVIDDINPIWHTGTNVMLDLAYYDNRVPVAKDKVVIITPPSPVTFSLEASDEDGDTLTYQYADPSQGSLTGTPPTLIYTPNTGYVSPDTFTFKVWDGEDWSNEAEVFLRTNAAPSIKAGEDLKEESPEDTPLPIDLNKYFEDPDDDELTFEILESPAYGDFIDDTTPDLIYMPDPNLPWPYDPFEWDDSFKIKVCDPWVCLDDKIITTTITQVNDPLNANPITFNVYLNTINNELNLLRDEYGNYHVSDYEGDTYDHWEIVEFPTNGDLDPTGTKYIYKYTPDDNFIGEDIFTYKVYEYGTNLPSNIATVTINVIERPESDYSIFLPLILK